MKINIETLDISKHQISHLVYAGNKYIAFIGKGKYYESLFAEHINSVEIFIPKASLTILGETPFLGVVGEVNYDSAAPQSSIGLQLLDYYNLILDFLHKKIYYQQLKDQYDINTWKNFGFKYRRDEDGIFVSFFYGKIPMPGRKG